MWKEQFQRTIHDIQLGVTESFRWAVQAVRDLLWGADTSENDPWTGHHHELDFRGIAPDDMLDTRAFLIQQQRIESATKVMLRFSESKFIPLKDLTSMRWKLNEETWPGYGRDVVFAEALEMLEIGIDFSALNSALSSIGSKKFAHLMDDRVRDVIKLGSDFKIVANIFEHMSVDNCENVTSYPSTWLRFEKLYPCLVRCGEDVKKLNDFVKELKARALEPDRLKTAMVKYGCYPVGTFDKAAPKSSVAEDVDPIGDSLRLLDEDPLS